MHLVADTLAQYNPVGKPPRICLNGCETIMYADLDSLRQSPLAVKLHVVEVLWDDIAASTEDFPLPTWLLSEVEQRVAEHEKTPTATLTREELWQRVHDKRG